MIPGRILENVFNSVFGSDYDIKLNNNLAGDTVSEYERYLRETEEIIVSAMKADKIRGLLRTAQSDYVAIAGVNTVSTTWSLEIADNIDNTRAYADIERVIKDNTEQTLYVDDIDNVTYSVALTFSVPVSYEVETINGIRYQNVVFSGSATITDKSALATDVKIGINDIPVDGLVSWSVGMTASGESYHKAGQTATLQNTATQSVSTAVSMDIHTKKDSELSKLFMRALLTPETTIQNTGAMQTYKLFINVDDGSADGIKAVYPAAKLIDIQAAGSIGSFIVLSLRFMRD